MIALPILATQISPAGFTSRDLKTHIIIDGTDYGYFDKIEDLDKITGMGDGVGLRKITIKRDFVTEPSLYYWAKNFMERRTGLKDVHVVMENRDGEELSTYVLKLCQPLTWTVEAANPAVGGFHEKIDLAVQEISIR